MATDLALLELASAPTVAFRHYGWSEPAVTFGYSQRLSDVHKAVSAMGSQPLSQMFPQPLPQGFPQPVSQSLSQPDSLRLSHPSLQTVLQRRPTGGGLVHHSEDWTYALVLPKNLPLAQQAPLHIYATVHALLATALSRLGCRVSVASSAPCQPEFACFTGATRHDLVDAQGVKQAGAALKRTRNGVLLQGSIAGALVAPFATSLARVFATTLSQHLTGDATVSYCETLPEPTLADWLASDAWNHRR